MPLILCGPVILTTGDAGADGARVPLPAKCLALLAYLALEPGPHGRDALGALLWGDARDAQAGASLRQALVRLRDAAGAALRADRASVELAADFESDVGRFLRLADAGSERALDVDVPRFLEGLAVRDATRFEEWAEATRDMLVRRYREALVAAARAAHARHDWPRAAALADRWQSLDPLSEEAAALRVEVRFLAGDRDGALATYRRFQGALRADTGRAPGAALRALAARVEGAPAEQAARHAARADAIPAFDAPLVGRAAEWAAMERALGEVARDGGEARVLLVEGEVGIGRSRLLADFMRLAAARGATVLRARAFAAGLDAPYGALHELLRGAMDAPGAAGADGAWLAEVARVVPEARQRVAPEPAQLAPAGALLPEAVAQLLLAIADEAPLVVALDDMQWFDGDSCHLLHHLVRRLEGTPILWCAATALGTVARDAPPSRLARALGALPCATRLRPPPLGRDEVWQLVRALGGLRHPAAGARLAARVHELTDGVPLFVVELLRTLFARGWLAVDPATREWITTESGDGVLQAGEMFPSVREGIAERVAGLPDDEHALLLTVCAAGGGCHTSVLSFVHGLSRLRAAHLCDALVERQLVVEEDGSYRCVHAIAARVVLDSVGAARRREVHRMIALALADAADSVRRPLDPGAVARHAAAGGEAALAHRHALLAAAGCAARGAWEEAHGWLDLAASCAETPDEARAAAQASATLLGRAGPPEAAPAHRGAAPSPQWFDRRDLDLLGTRAELP